ncbi:hypothetical protein MMC27_004309 [Xylographa pallens]|nr:hypothetical protein [Xylographa pallens]
MSSNYSSGDTINVFGPTATGQFDFTPLFEDTFFSIVPSVILIVLVPYRVFSLRSESRKVSRSFLLDNKLMFLAVFAIMQMVLLVLHATNSALRTRATIAAATLTFIDALSLCILSHLEHVRSVRPSAIINIYVLLTLPLDVARSRTLWLNGGTKSIAAVFTGTVGIKLLVLIVEAIEKRGILLPRYRNTSPETTSGIYSRSFFWWLNTLMQTGFDRVLNNKDLYPIDEDMTSVVLHNHAQQAWRSAQKGRSRALLWSTLKAVRTQLAYCVFPRLCLIAFRYAQPFLIFRTVGYASDPDESENTGWGLTAAFGVVFVGLAVSTGTYYHMVYRFVTSTRGSLISMIYAKTVDLSITAIDESIALTLMSSDTEAICLGFENINELWAVPIELGLALWLLERQLGLAFLAPAAVAIIATTVILIMARYIGKAQKIWIEGIQTRVDVTASMLGSMKAIKMLGFTDRLTNLIQGLRVKELKLSILFRRLLCGRVFFANSMGTLAPFCTFAVYVLLARSSGIQITSAFAYTTLSLIELLASPMNIAITTVPYMNAAMACLDRIQSFLESDARKDHRLQLSTPLNETVLPVPKGSIELRNIPSGSGNNKALPQLIATQNASFAWSVLAKPVVNDVTFQLLRGQFCFIIGPVGCGKSTLLKGLLGETPSVKGFVYSNTPATAYVDQTSWIQNGTIQQNILGISAFEEQWYAQVVRACALEYDISKLPNGHATLVGSAGISLSGGQKQRVAMARAIYAKNELVIFDDVFSGLDAETEEQVFGRLLGRQGLLRQLGASVLLATHAVHRLSYADHIIAMNESGWIAEQGSLQHLRVAGGYVQSLATEHKVEDRTKVYNEIPTNTDTTLARSGMVGKVEAEVEELNRQTGEFAVYKYYFSSVGWLSSFVFFGAMALHGIAKKMTELLIIFWTDAVTVHGNAVNGFFLGIYGSLTALTITGLVGGCYYFILSIVPRSSEILHARLLHTVMGAPLSFFTTTDTGTTTNRFSQDMTVIDTELPYSLIDLLLSFVVAVVGAILMCLSAGYFAATVPPIILIVWVLQKYYLRTSRQLRLLDLEAKSPLYSHFIESLSGLSTIRAFGWTDNFLEKNLTLLDVSQKPYYLLFCIQRWLGLILDLMVAVLAVVLMVLMVKLRSNVTSGFVGLALLNVMSFNQALATIVKEWTALETSIGAVARLRSFSSETVTENQPFERQGVPEDWPAYGNIDFRNVSASYTPEGTLVIQKLNLSIRAGEKIGICGRSGSGKSSLITTLFRMLEITADSSITIDGIDITTVPRQEIRSRLNAIPQEPFFIKGTIRSNADPYQKHSDAAIITAIRKVHLWEIVMAKGGLDADLDMEFFSHGQRQLFCLARAILRRSKIVILDEVTSSVDVASDALMQKVIREEFKACTILAVAHRLDTILDFDKIALLSAGELKEFDTPQALMSRPSAFRALYNS